MKNLMETANAVAVEEGIDEKYAAVTFSSLASVNFKFLPYSIAEQKFTMIKYPAGSTNTQAGLAEAMNLFLESLQGICFAVTKFPPVWKLCGNIPEIRFTEDLKVFHLQLTELLKTRVASQLSWFWFLGHPAKLSSKKKKKKEKKTCVKRLGFPVYSHSV